MSRAVAMASASLRRLAAASRPLIAARGICSSPLVAGRPVLLFRPGPVFLFPRDQSRSYAGGRTIHSSSGSRDFDDDEGSDEDLEDEVSDGVSDSEIVDTADSDGWGDTSGGWNEFDEESESDDSESSRPGPR